MMELVRFLTARFSVQERGVQTLFALSVTLICSRAFIFLIGESAWPLQLAVLSSFHKRQTKKSARRQFAGLYSNAWKPKRKRYKVSTDA